MNLWKFIEEERIAKLCSVERARALTPKHFQMVVKGIITSLVVLNKKIKGLFGVGCESFDGSCYLVQEVEGRGLHTFKGMVGYCIKDNGEEHFRVRSS